MRVMVRPPARPARSRRLASGNRPPFRYPSAAGSIARASSGSDELLVVLRALRSWTGRPSARSHMRSSSLAMNTGDFRYHRRKSPRTCMSWPFGGCRTVHAAKSAPATKISDKSQRLGPSSRYDIPHIPTLAGPVGGPCRFPAGHSPDTRRCARIVVVALRNERATRRPSGVAGQHTYLIASHC